MTTFNCHLIANIQEVMKPGFSMVIDNGCTTKPVAIAVYSCFFLFLRIDSFGPITLL
jgi:hypothetical protein